MHFPIIENESHNMSVHTGKEVINKVYKIIPVGHFMLVHNADLLKTVLNIYVIDIKRNEIIEEHLGIASYDAFKAKEKMLINKYSKEV
jgi:hypothetical protein